MWVIKSLQTVGRISHHIYSQHRCNHHNPILNTPFPQLKLPPPHTVLDVVSGLVKSNLASHLHRTHFQDPRAHRLEVPRIFRRVNWIEALHAWLNGGLLSVTSNQKPWKVCYFKNLPACDICRGKKIPGFRASPRWQQNNTTATHLGKIPPAGTRYEYIWSFTSEPLPISHF